MTADVYMHHIMGNSVLLVVIYFIMLCRTVLFCTVPYFAIKSVWGLYGALG